MTITCLLPVDCWWGWAMRPWLLSFLGCVIAAASDATDDLHAENSALYCDALQELASGEETTPRVFADVADGRIEGPGDWQEFESETERAKQDTGDNLNENAFVWFEGEMPVYVRYLYQSPSRDWALYVDYCFRADGSLARIDSDLRTFHGSVRVVRTMVFGASGEMTSRDEQIFELESGRPLSQDAQFSDIDVPVLSNVSNLAFYELLKTPASAEQDACVVPGITARWAMSYCMTRFETDDEANPGVAECFTGELTQKLADGPGEDCDANLAYKAAICSILIEWRIYDESLASCVDSDEMIPTVVRDGIG